MLAGNTFRRAKWDTPDEQLRPPNQKSWTYADKEQQARAGNMIGFNCLHYDAGFDENALARHYMPEKAFLDANCYNGIRAELMFPTCWNGELDSPNHKDHVAYPRDARNGPCPSGFEQRLPALFYETIYQTQLFARSDGEFVFANGDPTGYGYHGDFYSGWEGTTLQDAIDNTACTNGLSTGEQTACPVLDIKPDSEIMTCKMETPEGLQNEKLSLVGGLPGNVEVSRGPDWADVAPAEPASPAGPAAPAAPAGPAVSDASVFPAPVFTEPSGAYPTVPTASLHGTSSPHSSAPPGGNGTAIRPQPAAMTAAPSPDTVSTPPAPPGSYVSSVPGTPPFANISMESPQPTAPPAPTPPTPGPAANMRTITSLSTDAAGLLVEWVILQAVETTTIYVDAAGRTTQPTAPSSTIPLQPIKRHRHRHNHVRAHL
jgi:hypothetical protein